MKNSKTTIDCAAYGLCSACAEIFAENIRKSLMEWRSPHITSIAVICDDVTQQTMDICIEGFLGPNNTNEFMQRVSNALVERIAK